MLELDRRSLLKHWPRFPSFRISPSQKTRHNHCRLCPEEPTVPDIPIRRFALTAIWISKY
jgi:hypothetical protein